MYMTQGLRRAAKLTPNKIAMEGDGFAITWAEFQDRVARLAGAFTAMGLKSGDRIAMLGLNSPHYVEFFYGAFWMGGATVPLNIRWAVAEHIYALNDCGARALIVDDAFAEIGAEIAAGVPSIEYLIHAGDGDAGDATRFDDLIANHAAIADANFGGDDLAGVFYTGGTTGFPKGVMLPHRGLWTSAISFADASRLTPDDTNLHAAPMFHIAGCSTAFNTIILGGRQTFIPGFEPKAFLKAVETYKPTNTLLVPTMIGMLLQEPSLEGADTSSLTKLFYGASPMTQAILKEAMEKLPGTDFIHLYGQTEMSPLVTALGPEYHVLEGPNAAKIQSVGRPVVAVEVEIVDENNNEAPRGAVGEVRARGANTMLGYWNKPEQTAATLKDGWVHTGDGGYMDEDGFIYIVDRVKDMIITGGENVFSAEVENAVMQFPGLSECAVIGVPDDKWGEAVHAIVVPRAGQAPDPDAVIALCRTLIAPFKCPRSVQVRAEALPKSGAGKIQKFELRSPFWEGRSKGVS